jgi:hypothetical protein
MVIHQGCKGHSEWHQGPGKRKIENSPIIKNIKVLIISSFSFPIVWKYNLSQHSWLYGVGRWRRTQERIWSYAKLKHMKLHPRVWKTEEREGPFLWKPMKWVPSVTIIGCRSILPFQYTMSTWMKKYSWYLRTYFNSPWNSIMVSNYTSSQYLEMMWHRVCSQGLTRDI